MNGGLSRFVKAFAYEGYSISVIVSSWDQGVYKDGGNCNVGHMKFMFISFTGIIA